MPTFARSLHRGPRGAPSRASPRSRRLIGVVILSSPEFDARDVDPHTVRFGPAGATPRFRPLFFDVNHDERKDMLLVFRTRDTGIRCGDTEASLTGFTLDGTKIDGTDRIRTIGCRNPGTTDAR